MSKDRLLENEVLVEGELAPTDFLVGNLFYITPGWRYVEEELAEGEFRRISNVHHVEEEWVKTPDLSHHVDALSNCFVRFRPRPDYAGLRNFMAGCANASCRAARDFIKYASRQREGFGHILRNHPGMRMNSNTKAHASAEWTRRVAEKVKQLEQERRNDVPWDPYGC